MRTYIFNIYIHVNAYKNDIYLIEWIIWRTIQLQIYVSKKQQTNEQTKNDKKQQTAKNKIQWILLLEQETYE